MNGHPFDTGPPPGAEPLTPQPRQSVMDRRPYRRVRLVGSLVMVLVVSTAVAGAVPEVLEQERTEDALLPDRMTSLVLDAPRGDVRIRELPPGEQPRVQADATWTLTRPRLVAREEAGTVHLQAPCTEPNLGTCAVDLSVWVPEGTSLEVTSTFGDTHATSSGAVTVSATLGDIVVDGDPVRADLTSTAGDATLTSPLRAPESVRVRTTVGDIAVLLPPDERYAVFALSQHGDTQVQVPRDLESAHTVDIETTLGSVQVRASRP